MSSTRKSQSSQSSQSSILFRFLIQKSQKEGTVSKPDLFNPTTLENKEFSSLFSGILNSKERRSALFELMEKNGVTVRDGNVVFAPDFSSHIDAIVTEFLPKKESQPLKKGKGSCCGAAAVSSCQQIESQSSKHVGGGAVCHTRPNSKSITLSEFQKSSLNQEETKETKNLLRCTVCPHTNPDGSGTCDSKYKKCDSCHPFNQKSVVVEQRKTYKGFTILTTPICFYFQAEKCKYGPNCRNAHLSKDECAKVLEKNQAHKDKKTTGVEGSSEKPKNSPMIVPSQVHLGRPPQSSSSQEPFISTGLSRVAAELQDLAFQDPKAFFDKWFDFILERESASAAVSSTHRSYSPAVEVSDSDDEQGDQ